MEAAPEAPARPDPTTITVYFRLFAGLTSFISKRCFSHFFSMGPGGMFDRSSMSRFLLDDANEHRNRDRNVAHHHHEREKRGESHPQRIVAGVTQAQRLKEAPDPVVHVEPQDEHGQYVSHGDGPSAETGDHVVVDVPFDEARMR